MRFLKVLADRFKKWSIGESPEALGSLYVCRFGWVPRGVVLNGRRDYFGQMLAMMQGGQFSKKWNQKATGYDASGTKNSFIYF